MSLVVYKYPVTMEDHFALDLPEGSRLLSVQAQHDIPQLWALVDAEQKRLERRFFRVAGTGHPISEPPDRLRHVGSFQLIGGALVFHLFEISSPKG